MSRDRCCQGCPAIGQVRIGSLVLPVRGLRLHIHLSRATTVNPEVPSTEPKEPTVVTPTEIIYRRRVCVLEHATASKNVSETCRVFGISRTRFYEWKKLAE